MKKLIYILLLIPVFSFSQVKIRGGAGINGKSAYEVAVDNGFVGTEAAWLASLVGADGAAGATGATGPQGPAGLDGAQTWPLYRRAYLSGSKENELPAIDIKTDTIILGSFNTFLWFEDDMEALQLSTTRYINYSTIPDSRTVVLYYNRTDDVFAVTDEVTEVPIGDGKDYYFITSFRKQTNTIISPSAGEWNISSFREPSKITVLGDSHTQQGADWELEVERMFGSNPSKYSSGFVDMVRLGVNGSRISNNGANSFYQRRTQITADTDLLLVYGGHNDQGGAVAIGVIATGTFDDTTFIGAYQGIIEYAYSINPAMRIILIVPHRAYSSGVERDMSAYNQAILDVADYYSLPVLNLDERFQANVVNKAQYLLNEAPDELHLTDAAKQILARMMYEFIKDTY